jgi:hypothetical protein
MVAKNLIPVGIQTCQIRSAHADRRQGCLQTWVPLLDRSKFQPVFLIGETALLEDYTYDPPFLRVRCDDTLGSLTTKVKRFCQWFLTAFDSPYLFKCDDDSYLNPRLFNTYPFEQADVVGCIYLAQDGVQKPHGGGYSLSRACAQAVADQLPLDRHDEDWFVGKIVHALPGIRIKNEPLIAPWSFQNMTAQHMVGHFIRGLEAMREIHRKVGGS